MVKGSLNRCLVVTVSAFVVWEGVRPCIQQSKNAGVDCNFIEYCPTCRFGVIRDVANQVSRCDLSHVPQIVL